MRRSSTIHYSLLCGVVMLALTVPVIAADLPMEQAQGPSALTWEPGFGFEGAILTVGGPAGVVVRQSFGPGASLQYAFTDEQGQPLADGVYSWELVVRRQLSPAEAATMKEAEAEAARQRVAAKQLRRARGDMSVNVPADDTAKSIKEPAAGVDPGVLKAAEAAAAEAEENVEQVQRELEERFGPFVAKRQGRFTVRDGGVRYPTAGGGPARQESVARTPDAGLDSPGTKALTDSGIAPNIQLDDTQDEDCSPQWDWIVRSDGGTSDTDTANVFSVNGVGEAVSGNCGYDVQILRLEHDGGESTVSDSVDSIVVPSNGDLNFASGSVYIDRSLSRLGVNETAPSDDIHVRSSSPAIRFEDTSDGTFGDVEYDGGWLKFEGNTEQDIFQIDATAPEVTVAVDANGYFGIGDTPGTAGWFASPFSVFRDGYPQMQLVDTSTGAWSMYERGPTGMYLAHSDATGATYTIPFYVYSGAPWHLLNLTAEGVGITDGGSLFTASAPLHVRKSPVGGNSVIAEGGAFNVLRSDGGFPNVRFEVTGAGSLPGGGQSYLFSIDPNNGNFIIRNETDGRNAFAIKKDAQAQNLVVTNGRVGIMTNAPAGTLDVNGSIYQRGGVLHADYVFQPGYDLESIAEHSTSMWENGHLPSVPKAMVDDEGREVIEVGAHQRGILEELEKAHIYIDQLHGQLSSLQTEVAAKDAVIGQLEQRLERLEQLLQK